MEIKMPEYYNIRNHVPADKETNRFEENSLCLIQEITNEAYQDGYETGFKDGVASVEGGDSDA